MTNAGVYIHIPFCRSRCSYCDFATGMYQSEIAETYVGAICSEIRSWREVEQPSTVDTIYFGGGTPSLLTAGQIERLLGAVHDRFAVADEPEITLEINPGDGGTSAASKRNDSSKGNDSSKRNDSGKGNDSSKENDSSKRNDSSLDAALVRRGPSNEFFRDLRRLGINRASFGAQTFDDRELRLLGRTHDSTDVRKTFALLREAGFTNINFDLIAGLPGQTMEGWKRNLVEALRLRPEHLSLYLLDVHEGTPLADQINRGMRPVPDDDLAAEMYATMIETVCAAGYEHYEISNFCLPGFESRHNTKYWTGAPYYGFGNSAHSYDGARRRWANERDAAKYVEAIEHNDSLIVDRTTLSEEQARSESIFLGLRLMRGIDLQTYESRFGRNLREEYNGELGQLREAGLIEIDDQSLQLTTRGALLSNEVFAALG